MPRPRNTLGEWQASPQESQEGRPGDGGKDRKILCTVLHEAHRWQVEETMETLAEEPEGLYRSCLDRLREYHRGAWKRYTLSLASEVLKG